MFTPKLICIKMATDVQLNDVTKFASDLERQELEAAGGVATLQIYSQLLAVYFLQNDICNAKFLWKRIPANVKSGNTDLSSIWAIGQKMWQRDFPGIYEALKREWPDNVKPIMTALLNVTRRRAITLIGQAYSSISVEDFAAAVGLPAKEAIEAAISEGWSANQQQNVITPKKPTTSVDPSLSNEYQLSLLTDYVSFLEN